MPPASVQVPQGTPRQLKTYLDGDRSVFVLDTGRVGLAAFAGCISANLPIFGRPPAAAHRSIVTAVGFHPSAPARTLAAVSAFASASLICFAHPTRGPALPSPVLPYSA